MTKDKARKQKLLLLKNAGDTKIRRHIKIKSNATIFNPAFKDYFEQRALKRTNANAINNLAVFCWAENNSSLLMLELCAVKGARSVPRGLFPSNWGRILDLQNNPTDHKCLSQYFCLNSENSCCIFLELFPLRYYTSLLML